MSKLRGRISRPSPGAVIGVIALVAALGGGAYAQSKDDFKIRIPNKSVTSKKLVKSERSQGYFTRQTGAIGIPAGLDTEVLALALPTGSFQITASVDLGGTIATPALPTRIRCQIRDDGRFLLGGDATVESAGFDDTITLTWFTDGGSASINCNPQAPAQVRDRAISAIRVGRVTERP